MTLFNTSFLTRCPQQKGQISSLPIRLVLNIAVSAVNENDFNPTVSECGSCPWCWNCCREPETLFVRDNTHTFQIKWWLDQTFWSVCSQHRCKIIRTFLFFLFSPSTSCIIVQSVYLLTDERLRLVKGIVHPNMEIQSLSTHPQVDWSLDLVLQSTKHCWSFTAKTMLQSLPDSWREWWPVFKCNKTTG